MHTAAAAKESIMDDNEIPMLICFLIIVLIAMRYLAAII